MSNVRHRNKHMVHVTALKSCAGTQIEISLEPGGLESLAHDGKIDAYIVATEDGFSPLGQNRRFLAADLGISEEEIRHYANWNRFENQRVTLVAMATRRHGSCLRGVILAASETSECYKRFATPLYGRPYRDFYYNVAFESIAYASEKWGARRLAISHLSASGRFNEDIAICNAEALAHHCDATETLMDSFMFLGCCISHEHLVGISRLNAESQSGHHRAISTKVENREEHVLVHLEWGRDA